MTKAVSPLVGLKVSGLSQFRKISTWRMSKYWPYAVLFGVAAIPLVPIVWFGSWPNTHDGGRYFILMDLFRDAILHGIWYPRWIPDLMGRYGYPLFCFYQPGFFFLGFPFSFLPGYPLAPIVVELFALFVFGTLGVYKLCKEIGGPSAGLYSAIFFVFTPYIYVNLYVRGDLSELAAMLLCPWPLYLLLILKKRVRDGRSCNRAMIPLALSLAGLVFCHPATSLFFTTVFFLVALCLSRDKVPMRPYLTRVIVSAVLALSLSSSYWLTVFQMRDLVHLDWAFQGIYSADENVVHFLEFFRDDQNSEASAGEKYGDMSFQLGLIHFLLATLGATLCRKNTTLLAVYGIYLCAIVLMTPVSVPIWRNVELLRMVQFPWRILSITATLQIVCIAAAVGFAARRLSLMMSMLGFSAVLVSLYVWHSDRFVFKHSIDIPGRLQHWLAEEKYASLQDFSRRHEYVPKTVASVESLRPRARSSPVLWSSEAGFAQPFEGNSSHHIRYRFSMSKPGLLRIEQLYFPGWRVILDGLPVPSAELESNLTIDGRMTLSLPAGEHVIDARFDGPPGWRDRNIVVCVIVLAFLGFCIRERRKVGYSRPRA